MKIVTVVLEPTGSRERAGLHGGGNPRRASSLS